METQEIFDRVKAHLLAQGERSVTVRKSVSICAYRGADGRKCAIGVLIPDDRYSAAIETLAASDSAIMALIGLTPTDTDQAELLDALQHIHDDILPSLWEGALRSIARSHGLKP